MLNYFIEAKVHKLAELVIPTVSASTWLCVAYHLSWIALHTKRDKHFYFWILSKYKT